VRKWENVNCGKNAETTTLPHLPATMILKLDISAEKGKDEDG